MSLVLMVFVVAAYGEAHAFVVQKINNKYEHWLTSDLPISYKIYQGGPGGELDPTWIPAITSSFDTWGAVSTATVSFQYEGTTTDVSTKGKDGENVILWVTEEANWSYGVDVSAYTTTYLNASTGRIVEFDMEINATPSRIAAYPWSVSGEPLKIDLQSAVTHEIGHVIGLDHVGDPNATMYPNIGFGEIGARDLAPDDENGVSFIYPTDNVILEIVSGNDQTGTPGNPLSEPLRVRIKDQSGNPLQGSSVIFDILSGTGTLSLPLSVETDTGGLADTTFTPDSTNKAVVRATGPGLTEQIFWVNNNAPVLSWTGEPNYVSDGLNPESGNGDTVFTFRVTYTDADNDPPAVSRVWIDMDGDDIFEADEKFTMFIGSPPPYSSGVIYRF